MASLSVLNPHCSPRATVWLAQRVVSGVWSWWMCEILFCSEKYPKDLTLTKRIVVVNKAKEGRWESIVNQRIISLLLFTQVRPLVNLCLGLVSSPVSSSLHKISTRKRASLKYFLHSNAPPHFTFSWLSQLKKESCSQKFEFYIISSIPASTIKRWSIEESTLQVWSAIHTHRSQDLTAIFHQEKSQWVTVRKDFKRDIM